MKRKGQPDIWLERIPPFEEGDPVEDEWRFVFSEPFEIAQAEVYEALDAWDHGARLEAVSILERVLETHPDHVGALSSRGGTLIQCDLDEEGLDLCAQAVRICRACMPPEFDIRKSELSSLHLRNTPFLRAYFNIAHGAWRFGEWEKACWMFETILSLDPSDRLGSRCMLMPIGFALHSPRTTIKACTHLGSVDWAADTMYSLALARIQLQEYDLATPILEEAVKGFPRVAKELLAKRHRRPKDESPWGVSVGSEGEAYLYWSQFGRFWEATPAAMTALRKIAGGAPR